MVSYVIKWNGMGLSKSMHYGMVGAFVGSCQVHSCHGRVTTHCAPCLFCGYACPAPRARRQPYVAAPRGLLFGTDGAAPGGHQQTGDSKRFC